MILRALAAAAGIGLIPLLVDSPSDSPVGSSLDSALDEAVRRIEGCADACPGGVVYVWTERMPLSRLGIDEISAAAEALDAEVTVVTTEEVRAYADDAPEPTAAAEALLAAGALAHAPALIVYAERGVLGPAILGYKSADAYESAIRRRLAAPPGADGAATSAAVPPAPLEAASPSVMPSPSPSSRADFQSVRELEAVGRPGAYFRWVPGWESIAYESGGRIYLLDLSDGRSLEAPGYVDFVPTPDGRLFVTPGPRRRGLEFYDARAVFEAARAGEPGRVDPVVTDPRMRDQYPSVGILEEESASRASSGSGTATTYRVLTSWFEGIRSRDYEVGAATEVGRAAAEPEVRPLGEPGAPCGAMRLSIPILSQDGREVAARDESTGTTKIFRIRDGGSCEEVEDLGVQTGKVAWHWSGRLLAFARPPLRSGESGRDPALAPADGIFLHDRDEGRTTRIAGSEDASSVAFPEFVGNDRLVYLVPGRGEPSVFRMVEGIR